MLYELFLNSLINLNVNVILNYINILKIAKPIVNIFFLNLIF
jgi:hypothetical protein